MQSFRRSFRDIRFYNCKWGVKPNVWYCYDQGPELQCLLKVKETKSATMNIFRFFFYFLFKSFVKVDLSYVFTINLFTIAENCTEK